MNYGRRGGGALALLVAVLYVGCAATDTLEPNEPTVDGPLFAAEHSTCIRTEDYYAVATTPVFPGFSAYGTLSLVAGAPLLLGGHDVHGWANYNGQTTVSGVRTQDQVYVLNFNIKLSDGSLGAAAAIFASGPFANGSMSVFYPNLGQTIVWNLALTRTGFRLSGCSGDNGRRG